MLGFDHQTHPVLLDDIPFRRFALKHFRQLSFALALISVPALAQDPEAVNHYRTGYDLMQKRSYRNAAIALEKAVVADSTYGNAHYALARAYKILNEYNKSISGFTAARALGTKPDRCAKKLAQLYYKAAVKSYGQKKYSEAIAYFENALEFNPENAKALYAMGLSYNGLRESTKAKAAFKKAINADAKYAKAHKALGDIQRRDRDYGPAATSYQAAINADAKYTDAYGGLALVKFETTDVEGIVPLMEKALSIDAKYAEGHLFLGNALSQLGRQQDAVGPLRRAAELDSKNCEARFRLGEAYYGIGNYRQTIEAAQQATRCQRDYRAAEVLLGDGYFKLSQFEEARSWYGRAIADSRFKDYATHQLEEIKRLSKGP